jgi:hypothetical protein
MKLTKANLPIWLKVNFTEKISTNEIYGGVHWSKRNKHKENMLYDCIDFKKVGFIDCKVNIHMDFYFKSHSLDSSNCSYMAKMIEDCLVKYGVLKDDSIKYVSKFSLESHKGTLNYVNIAIDKAE